VTRLAGSAAVALMVLSIIREPVAALGYLFAVRARHAIVGMMLITLILSAAVWFTAVNLPKFNLAAPRGVGPGQLRLRGGPDLRHRLCRGRLFHTTRRLGFPLTAFRIMPLAMLCSRPKP